MVASQEGPRVLGSGFSDGVGGRDRTCAVSGSGLYRAELQGSKMKKGKGFLKPNFELLPNLNTFLVGTLDVFMLNRS